MGAHSGMISFDAPRSTELRLLRAGLERVGSIRGHNKLMIEALNGRFEPLQHQVFGGHLRTVPLLVLFGRGLGEDSRALLLASDILGGDFGDYFPHGLVHYREHCDQALRGEAKPFTVVDELLPGAVSVGGNDCVGIAGREEKFEVSPELFLAFLDKWVEFSSAE